MLVEVGRLTESQTTAGTNVRLFARVTQFVPLQVLPHRKGLTALAALVRLGIDMHQLVPLQSLNVSKGLAALEALMWPFMCVNPRMRGQILFVPKLDLIKLLNVDHYEMPIIHISHPTNRHVVHQTMFW